MAVSEALKTEITTLVQGAQNRQAVVEALTFLFPKLGATLHMPTTEYAEMPGRSPRRRISSADFARSYFNLTPDETVWGKSQADALVLGDPNQAFDSYRDRIAITPPEGQAKLRRVFIDLLISITQKAQRPTECFMIFLDRAGTLFDSVPESKERFFDLDVDTQITFLLNSILKPLGEAERHEIISHAIVNAADISFLCDVFRSFAGDVEAGGADGQSRTAFGDQTEELRRLLVERVKDAAQSRKLYELVRPQDILWFWWGSGHGQDVRQHTAEAMEDRTALRSLLRISVSTVRSTAGNYEHVDRRSWSKIIDLEELRRRAMTISSDPSDPDFDISRRFLVAYSRNDKDQF